MYNLPVFYYPSTLVWVDDDALFLKAVSQLLTSNNSVKTFSNPESCLEFFNSYSLPLESTPFLKGCEDHEYYHTANHSLVNLNVPQLNSLNSNQERNLEVSVIVLDYNMQAMNGIELAKKLAHLPAKKILLTGTANQQEAINAFNDNTIDRFVRKDSATLVADIQKYISDLMQQYFREKTRHLLAHLEVNNPLPLTDPKFSDFFNRLCQKMEITEYYVLDKNGSFKLVSQNKTYYLIIHSDKSLDLFTDLHDDVEESYDLLESIKVREKIPFFGIGKESWEFAAKDWKNYFFVSNVLEGRERHYWALISL